MWKLFQKGPYVPYKIFGDRKVPKKVDEYDEDDNKKMTPSYQAINILWCALDAQEYNHVSGCETTNAIWKLLEITHEGTNWVKRIQNGSARKRLRTLFFEWIESIRQEVLSRWAKHENIRCLPIS